MPGRCLLMEGIKRNIRLFHVYMFLNRLEMWEPIVVLLVLSRGFSLTQYALLDSLWYLSTLVFEIPTGAVTDRYGKRISLLISALTQSASFLLLAFGRSFLLLALSNVLWGFASSFETGTSSAFIYDSLKQVNREGEYRRVMGRNTTLVFLASALGSIVAGLLGGIDLTIPIVITAAIPLLTSPLILLFREPEVADAPEPTYLRHIRQSTRYVLGRRTVALLLLYAAIVGAFVWAMRDFYQPLLDSYGISVQAIGMLYLLFKLCCSAGAHFADPISKRIGQAAIYLIPACLVVSASCMGWLTAPWAVGFIFVIFFVEGFSYPVLDAMIGKRIPSGKRATIISLGSVLSCLMSSALNPVLGYIGDAFSLRTVFWVLALGTLIAMSAVLGSLRRETV